MSKQEKEQEKLAAIAREKEQAKLEAIVNEEIEAKAFLEKIKQA